MSATELYTDKFIRCDIGSLREPLWRLTFKLKRTAWFPKILKHWLLLLLWVWAKMADCNGLPGAAWRRHAGADRIVPFVNVTIGVLLEPPRVDRWCWSSLPIPSSVRARAPLLKTIHRFQMRKIVVIFPLCEFPSTLEKNLIKKKYIFHTTYSDVGFPSPTSLQDPPHSPLRQIHTLSHWGERGGEGEREWKFMVFLSKCVRSSGQEKSMIAS